MATGTQCGTEAEWREQLGAELAERGLTAWSIDADQVEPDRQCNDVGSILPVERRVVLIGQPAEAMICDPRSGC